MRQVWPSSRPPFLHLSTLSWKPLSVLRSIEMTQKIPSIPEWIMFPIKHPSNKMECILTLSLLRPPTAWSLCAPLKECCHISGNIFFIQTNKDDQPQLHFGEKDKKSWAFWNFICTVEEVLWGRVLQLFVVVNWHLDFHVHWDWQ